MKSWKTPTPEQVSRAIGLFGQVEQYRYFFDRLQNPLWIAPLKQRGYFRMPPPPEHDESRGTIAFPPWPETQYLARMAPLAPEVVAQILSEVPVTENLRVHEDLIEAALGLPPALAAPIVPKAAAWLKLRYHSLLPEKTGALIAHLAKGAQVSPALELARALLEVLPDPRFGESSEAEEYRLSPEPSGRFDLWNYQRILEHNISPLVAAAGVAALKVLCDLLEKAISLSQLRSEATPPEDYSFVWRPAIEEHGQNLNLSLKEALVVAVRDAVEQLARENLNLVPTLVGTLEARPWRAFHRVALHLLRIYPDPAGTLVAERLTNRQLFEDIAFRHEYALLLQARFSTLDPAMQRQVLSWVEEGPDLERYRAGGRQWSDSEPTEADCAQYAAQWRRDKLALFGDSLPASLRDQYQALVAQHGPAEHPEFASYHSGVWHGPTSPASAPELRIMTADELATYLKTWVPTGGFTDPTPEGLGRELTSLVSEDPQRFAFDANKFQLEEPTYVRSIFRGFCEAVSQGRKYDWIPVLGLCLWAARHPREAPGDRGPHQGRDPHWGWTRKSVAELLTAGFAEGPMELPVQHREIAWQILSPIITDPDPTPGTEAEYSQDPATLAINTTRGEAMHTVVEYALWLRRDLLRLPEGKERTLRGFQEMPEVRAVLDDRLNVDKEASPAIRSVYGQRFPWLGLLDTEWAKDRAGQIFPMSAESSALWRAAWNTYIRFCAPYDDVLKLLGDQYRLAADRLMEPEDREGIGAPQYRLVEHLMSFYWRGKLALDDAGGLLAHFYGRAPLSTRVHAIAFIGRSLHETKGPVEPVILERLKKLWAARVTWVSASADPAKNAAELSNFGWWFASGKFENDWAFTQLKETLRLSKKAELDAVVAERLATLATDAPESAVECLTSLVEADEEKWAVLGWAEHAKRILEAALLSGDANAKDLAIRLIHRLGALGRYEFRELIDLAQ
jgi:hypothetical protein